MKDMIRQPGEKTGAWKSFTDPNFAMRPYYLIGIAGFYLMAMMLPLPVEAGRYSDWRAVRSSAIATTGASSTATQKTVVDLLLQIDRLQQQVRKLRNDVEVLNHEIKRLKKRQQALLEDIDRRVSVLERGGVTAKEPSTKGKQTTKSASRVSAKRLPASNSKVEYKQYDVAFNLMRQGFYTRAAKAFRQFIAKYPDSTLAGNAQYWLGEANYHVRNFKKALIEFRKVIDTYPRNRKVGAAWLKIGYSYYEIGDLKRSRQVLTEVIRRYPNTANAKSAQVRLNRMKRKGR